MNNAKAMQLMAKRQGYNTSHVLHLLLSVISVGIWIPVWIIVAISNANERGKIDRQMEKLEN